MIVRSLLALGLLLCTSGCGIIVTAQVEYLHSPNSLPPAGPIFVEPADYPYAADAYGWLGMYGYQKAPTAESATYVVYLTEVTGSLETDCDDDGNCYSILVGPLHGTAVHIVMQRGYKGDQQPPLVEIEASPAAGFGAAATIPRLLEIAFADFPGVDGSWRDLRLQKSGDLICVKLPLVPGWLTSRPLHHCRAPDAPPGILSSAPTS